MLAKSDVLVEIEVKVFKVSLGRGILLHGLSPNPILSIVQIHGKLSGLNFQLWIGGVWSSTLLVFQFPRHIYKLADLRNRLST